MSVISDLCMTRSILICAGPGGVGKTTTAAAIGVLGASLGLACCVVTIDPARRLGDALGLSTLGSRPHRVDGAFSGSLDAAMLDAPQMFDTLVETYAPTSEQADQIKANHLYRNLASSLAGIQEYMATEAIYELFATHKYDLIVVDTPPSRHALDFLDAPKRLTGFLDNRLFRLVTAPSRSSMRVLGVAAQALLRTISKVAGREIVEDTISFFQTFEGMELGFRDRAASVEALIASDATAFILVASPRREALEAVSSFEQALSDRHRDLDAFIVNRVQPDFGDPEGATVEAAGSNERRNLAELAFIARQERTLLNEFAVKHPTAALVEVPLLRSDVHDISGLSELVRYLT